MTQRRGGLLAIVRPHLLIKVLPTVATPFRLHHSISTIHHPPSTNTMSLTTTQGEKLDNVLAQQPQVTIFLKPIAPPAALGLAGFAGSTFITASWIAGWWGTADSPTVFFPFVATFGGLSQFIAGLFGFAARDTLVTVVNTMWGSFWLAIGLLYYLVVSQFPRAKHSNSRHKGKVPNFHMCRPTALSPHTACTLTSPNWRLGSLS